DGELIVGRPDDEVCIVTNSDRALEPLEGNLLRRLCTQPTRQVQQRKPSATRLRPNNRQPQLQRRDTTPRLHEVATLAQLHLSRTRRMVRDDEIDRPISQPIPKLFAIGTLPNRWTTLKLRGTRRNLLRGKVQIVWTCLSRDLHTCVPSFANHRNRFRRGKVNDVHASVEFTTQTNHQLYRFILRGAWTRREKVRILPRLIDICSNRSRQLRMHDQHRSKPRELRHRKPQVRLSHMRKL